MSPAADAAVLERAAQIIREWSSQPDGFMVAALSRVLTRLAARIRAESAAPRYPLHDGDVTVPPAPAQVRLGRIVRAAWIAWARTQPAPKPSWLTPWEDLTAAEMAADMRIGDAVQRAVAADLLTQIDTQTSWPGSDVTPILADWFTRLGFGIGTASPAGKDS